MTRRAAELLAAIYADPRDSSLRQVYADVLSEAGDPRGELITLQIQGARTPAQQKRERSLIHAHWKTWVGSLAPHMKRGGLHFERGFLTRCWIQQTSGPKLAKLVGDPIWSTVEHVGFCMHAGERPGVLPLVMHPVMRSLRSVSGLDDERFAALASVEAELPFTTIEVECTSATPFATTIAEARALPHVRTLGVSTRIWGRPFNPVLEMEWLFAGAMLQRVERLRIGYVGPLGALLDRLRSLPRLREVEVVELWELCLHNEPSGYRHRFTRDGDGRFSRLEVGWVEKPLTDEWSLRRLCDSLAQLAPDALTELRVAIPQPAPALLETALARFKTAQMIV
jgi:uncharacterized protein (TIGR02996 family)